MTWFRVGGAGIPATLKNAMNAVLNKKFGTTGQNYPPAGWPDDVNLLGPLPEGTATGSIANFSDGADDVPTKNVIATIAPTLTGVFSVNVTQTGKNLVDGTNFTRGLPSTTIGASIETISASTRYAYFGTPIKGGNYTVSSVSNDTDYYNAILIFGYTNGILSFYTNATVNASKTVDLSACDYARIAIGSRTVQITVPTDFTDYGTIQFEVGSATTYEPYQTPSTYSAALGRTIYGGTADLVNGVGKSTRIKKTVRWGDLGNVTQLADVTRKEIVLSASEESKYITASASTDLLNDKNLPYDMTYSGNFEHIYIANSSRIWVYLANGTDADTEITVSYTLTDALQTDFTFDSQEINSLYGVNNFWNDAGGDTTVIYRRDIDLALQAVSSSRGLMMASRPVTQLVGEESDPDQVNELVENDEIEQEGEDDAR